MNALEQAQDILAAWVQAWHTPEDNRFDAQVAPADLISTVQALDDHGWGYLVAITGLDHGAEAGEMEVLYHFCRGAAVLTLRVAIARGQAAVPSVCAIIPYASVFERELAEMLGVEVYGTPDPSRLFLPDDWPEAVYPLRKDAELD
ncbi:MAG: NADH-quinone oxidoreductase subunit C [Anaerolineae bacterium]|nr:NADH-quinone oxidoreductase subunit C [Anaerolineae bacterium]